MSHRSVIDECFDVVARHMREVDATVKNRVPTCEAYVSAGYDPTGENAEECRTRAWWYCENCESFLCDSCSQTSCPIAPYEHKLLSAKEAHCA